MSKGQSPETQVRGGVGDTAKAELDRVNDLVNKHFAKVKVTAVAVAAVVAAFGVASVCGLLVLVLVDGVELLVLGSLGPEVKRLDLPDQKKAD